MLSHFLRALQKQSSSSGSVQLVGVSSAEATSGSSSITISVPSAAQAGDLLVVFGVASGGTVTWASSDAKFSMRMNVNARFIATYQGWDGVSSSYSFSVSSTGVTRGLIMAVYRNAVWDTRGEITAANISNFTAAGVDVILPDSVQLVFAGSGSPDTADIATPYGFVSDSYIDTYVESGLYRNLTLQPAGTTSTVTYNSNAIPGRAVQSIISPVVSNPISFVGAGAITTGINPQAQVPSGVQAGDLLVIVGSSSANFTVPSGWTAIVNNTAAPRQFVAWKIAGSSETAPTVANSGSATAICMLAYRGANSATPINAQSTTSGGSNLTSVTTNALTTTVANTRVVSLFVAASTSALLSPRSGSVRVHQNTLTANRFCVTDEPQPVAGASKTRTADSSASVTLGTIAFAIRS